MSFQSSVSFINPPQNFGIKVPAPFVPFNRQPLATSVHVSPLSLGNTGAAIPLGCVASNTVVVSPSSASPNNVYTLPTAQQILAEYGEPLGATKLQAGDIIYLNIVNSGAFAAQIAAGTGSTGAIALIAYSQNSVTGATNFNNYTGSIAPLALGQTMGIQFTSVSQGNVNNIGGSNVAYAQATGTYSIFWMA